jgi:hypothetical protein
MADFDYESSVISNPPPSPSKAGVAMVSSGEAHVDASLAKSDMIGLCVLPKGCVPLDFALACTDLDGGASLAMSIGIAKTARSDLYSSTTFIATTAVGQAGGIDKPDATDLVLRQIKAKNVDRIIAAKITTVASTPAAGYIRGELIFKAAEQGDWSSYPSSIASHPLV